MSKKLSETFTIYCPLDNKKVCKLSTAECRDYTMFLEHLLETVSPVIFTNGGSNPFLCPGACGKRKQYHAIVKECEKEGVSPDKYLEKMKVKKPVERFKAIKNLFSSFGKSNGR